MKRTLIRNLKQAESVVVKGFVQSIREHSSVIFLELRDVSGLGLCIIEKSKELGEVGNIPLESVLSIEGSVIPSKSQKFEFEIQVTKVEVLSTSAPRLPIPVVEKGENESELQTRLNHRWIDLRKPKNLLIFKVWTTMEQAFTEFCLKNNYIRIHSPKFLGAPSESGAELFELEYFGKKAYLAQSPQFYKQMAMASGFEKVFEVGSVFRAEPSYTVRHATEFIGYDVEFSYIESHIDVIKEQERMLHEVLSTIAKKHGEEIEQLYGRKVIVPEIHFPQITMKEAKEILKSRGIASEKEGDVSPEEERELCIYMKEKTGHEFVFLTEFPFSVRPFYHMKSEENPEVTKSYDLLWNGHEITTGSQREHRYEILMKQAKEKSVHIESLQFYLNFFKYGCPPHGGFGIGPARMLMKIFGLENIREVMFLFRGPKRLTP